MRIQLYNESTGKIITFVSATDFNTMPECSWNELTPAQELAYCQFVLVDTTGFNTVQTPANNLYELWNMNGKYLHSSYWGTRMLTIKFINQNYAASSSNNVSTLFYNVLRTTNNKPLRLSVVDDFGGTYYTDVVLQSPNTNQLIDSITLEMLSDVFNGVIPSVQPYTLGTNLTSPLQLPMTISGKVDVTGDLKFERDTSTYFPYPAPGGLISFTNTAAVPWYQFIGINGVVCYITIPHALPIGVQVIIDPNKKTVRANGLLLNSTWSGYIMAGPGRMSMIVSSETQLVVGTPIQTGVIHI